jgi:hypothetical protein
MDLAQKAELILRTPPAERFAAISSLFFSEEQNLDHILFLAMYLRDRGASNWAKSLFIICCESAEYEKVSLYEMGILLTQEGNLTQAIDIFDQIRAKWEFSFAQNLFMARQYARAQRLSDAYRLIETVFEREPTHYSEAVAEYQFLKYLEEYPCSKALHLLESEQNEHRVLSYEQVKAELLEALGARCPYSLIRLGDGEGLNLLLSVADESKFGVLYRRGRIEFHNIWYGGQNLAENPSFVSELRRVQSAYENADCLSIIQDGGIRHEYAIGSPRGIPALNNMTRFLESRRLKSDQRFTLCEANIHRRFLLSGFLSDLLAARRFVGLISCYADLPRRLRETFSIERISLVQTGGELKARESEHGNAESSTSGEQFLSDHHETLGKLGDIEAGELYLVAAGIFGKIYCDIIKRNGGIAIDIGSVVDIWMNVATRSFSQDEITFVL